jgi:hypothetical protein
VPLALMTSTLLVVSDTVLPLLNGMPTSSIASLRPKPLITSPLLLNWAALSISRRLPMPGERDIGRSRQLKDTAAGENHRAAAREGRREDAAAEERQGAVVDDVAGELAS